MTSELIERTLRAIQPVESAELRGQLQSRLDSLTKPQGSLGRLEELALRYGLVRGTTELRVERKKMFIFCADHRITEEGVSAYPSEVTLQMVRNFVRGGAAINVLCRRFGIGTTIVDMGVNAPSEPGAVDCKIASGTANWLHGPAMTREQAARSIEVGIGLADEADVFGVGEMGIGNTTTAAALFCAFAGVDAALAAGRGTGVSDSTLRHKTNVIRQGLALHKPNPRDPIGVLASLGGFEIGGICGLLLGAAAKRIPVAVDGFIACSAALIAQALAPHIGDYIFYAHESAESGHARMLEFLRAKPLLTLGMRLGEGTGAALVINLIETAVSLYREMATFSEASVSTSEHPL